MKLFRHLLALTLSLCSFGAMAAGGMAAAGQGIDGDGLEGYFWYDDVAISLGASALVVPQYQGASNYEFTGFPLIDLDYKKILFLSTQRGLGVQGRVGPLVVGTRLTYDFGRDNENYIKYMSNLAGSVDAGLFARLIFGGWAINLDGQSAITQQGHNGTFGGVSLAYFYRDLPFWEFLTRGGVGFADANYMNAYFGVTQGEANKTGFAPYQPGGGYKDANFAFTATYTGIKHWKILSTAGVSVLGDKPKESDVVRATTQYRLMLGLLYVF
jgi:outer membrane scaffolding protein for murein synthesis (MipA/OmpV family)